MITQAKFKVLYAVLLPALCMLFVGCSEFGQLSKESVKDEVTSKNSKQLNTAKLERNKQAVRAFKAAQWDAKKMATAYDVFSPDYVNLRSEFRNLAVNADDPALQAIADPLNVAIPDRVDAIEVIVAEGDVVGIQTRITGTHKGNLYGIPATGKSIDIVSTAFYTFENGKIVEAWEMADEAGLLRQLGTWLPKRSDGLSVAPAINHPVQYGGQVLVDVLSQPEDSDTYANKVRVAAYKAQIRPRNQPDAYVRPANQVFKGAPYEVYTRRGFMHVAERSMELGTNDQGMGQAFPDRTDMVGKIIAEGNQVMIQFLLSGTNSGSLFGNPASNGPVGAWEVGVHTFDGREWKEGWWFGDDVGMLLQIGAPGEFLIPAK